MKTQQPDIEAAIKAATKRYRESCVLGKRLPLTVLRIVYRQAFLDGSRWVMEALRVKVPPRKGEKAG